MDDNRKKALAAALGQIEKQFGKGSVMRLGEELAYELLRPIDGSISAEHGIGLERRHFLNISRTAHEIEAMRAVKRALDPHGILNPGKVFE